MISKTLLSVAGKMPSQGEQPLTGPYGQERLPAREQDLHLMFQVERRSLLTFNVNNREATPLK